MSAWMMPSLRAATAMRVWQRQSMEWIAAVLAAEPTAMPRSMSRRLQVGPANSSSCGVVPKGLGGVEELGAGGVAAGAAVVVGWVPVGQPDEQHRVDGFGDVGVAEPDRLPALLAAGPQPAGQLRGASSASSTMTVSMKRCLPCEEQLAAGLGGGDRRGGHELGDLADGVGPDGVVVEVLGHAASHDVSGATRRRGRRRRTRPAPAAAGRRPRRRGRRARWRAGPGRAGRCRARSSMSAACTIAASRTRAGSPPRSKWSISTSKVHRPSRWSNSAPGASKLCASCVAGDGEDLVSRGRRGSRRRGR